MFHGKAAVETYRSLGFVIPGVIYSYQINMIMMMMISDDDDEEEEEETYHDDVGDESRGGVHLIISK